MSSTVTFASPTATAPRMPVGESSHVQQLFIARQPILDRTQQIHGYELLSRSNEAAQASSIRHTGDTDTATMFNALSNFGTEALFGDKSAFINCTLEGLSGEHFEIVTPERIVLEIPEVAGHEPAEIERIAGKLKELRHRGFRLAAGLHADLPAYAGWLPSLNYIKADVLLASDATLKSLLRKAALNKAIKLVAEKVETREQHTKLFELGFQYFQGYYFAKPQTVTAKVMNPAYSNVLQLMDLVLKQADMNDIENVLKRDPALSFKLLRYINSSGFGLMCEVTSFRHAVMILGFNKLFRWLTLLFATVRNSSCAPALARMAVTRGRMMELVAQKLLPRDECDNAFVVGIFSTLDIMLGVPMEKALASINLAEPVADALLHRHGSYGPFLQLVEACEKADMMTLELLSMSLGLDGETVSEAHLSALAWTETLGI